jgi:3-phenylpropionate/trans-cinnamate dioxygenase ferredoxin reductase subunit
LLRQRGFQGSIALITDEGEQPYERPPLSKEYLAGEKPFDRLLFHPPAFWGERDIQLMTGAFVTDVDALAHELSLMDGRTVNYGTLIWAAGGRPRKLTCEGTSAESVHTIRNCADVDAVRCSLNKVSNVVVIGGGYIGLEVAAVLTRLGKKVTLLETLDRVLSRVAGEPLSRFFEAEHRRHGVDLRTNVQVDKIETAGGRVAAVHTIGGSRIACEMVIVGTGIEPNVKALLAAGARGSNGIDVDEYCRTSLPDVFAVGDCAAHENAFAGRRVRLESVQNASDQAATAVSAIMGDPRPYHATPWFWSNQYDLRLQTVGLSTGYESVIVRGDPAGRSFSVIYVRSGTVVALDCINATKDYVQGRKLVEAKVAADQAALERTEIPLKSLVSG